MAARLPRLETNGWGKLESYVDFRRRGHYDPAESTGAHSRRSGGRLPENFPVLTSVEKQSAPSRGASIKALLTHRRLLIVGCLALSCLALTTFGFSQYRNVILLLGCEVAERDFGGGPGGRPMPDARCDSGFVAVGFHAQTGEFFNQAWLDCVPMRSDGTLGEERRMTNHTGPSGGRDVHDAQCRPGSVLRGLRGRTGASIDEAIGQCSPLRDLGDRRDRDDRSDRDDRRDRNDRNDNGRVETTNPITIPRPGGRPSEAHCPSGSVLVGFRSRGAEWMDHLSILCSDVQRTY